MPARRLPGGHPGGRVGSHVKLRPATREALTAYSLISPWLVGFLVFVLGPTLVSLFLAFTRYKITAPPVWVGAANYQKIFTGDPLFWQSLKVTFTYALLSLPLNLVLGLAIAVLLNLRLPGLSIWRTIYFLPSVISGVAVALLWIYIFSPRFGILNWMLSLVGIKGPAWLDSRTWALPSLVVMSLWGVGGSMILYLAGLQGVPTQLYDAAKVDGTNAWQRFWAVTLPGISPVVFYNLVMGAIGTFQYFTNAYVMTSGGPNYATLFYNLYLFNNAFRYFEMGYASALAWILFLIILVLTLLVFRSSSLWVYYEGQLRGRS